MLSLLKEIQHFDFGDSSLDVYYSHVDDADNYFDQIKQLNFKQNHISMYGKTHAVPRLEAWYGDFGYTYSGISIEANPMPEVLKSLLSLIENLCGHRFNSCLVNLYRDGQDYVSWHQDNEPELGEDPIIASVSFGETRKFKLKRELHNGQGESQSKLDLNLSHGDIVIMGSGIQKYWKHMVPKSKKNNGIRINITFRFITNPK